MSRFRFRPPTGASCGPTIAIMRQASILNLILAGVWLGMALVAFAQPHLDPGGREWVIPVFDWEIPVSWVALAFCIYNLVRWAAMQRSTPKSKPAPPPVDTRIQPSDPQWDFSRPGPRDEAK